MTWRNRLLPASFRGLPFHVDDGEVSGGRRVAPHEYPKRNTGYTEDMGRRQRLFRLRGYIIGPNYDILSLAFRAVLEADGSGLLVLPLQGQYTVICAHFSHVETREEGGFASFDLDFIEAGTPVSAAASTNTGSAVTSAADSAAANTASSPMGGIQ